MALLIVPHAASTTSVTVWIGAAVDLPASLELQVGARQPTTVGDQWSVWETKGRAVFWSQRVKVEGLEPGRRYPLRLLADGAAGATGTAVTMPASLPPRGATPFVCLLGSCFAHFNDAAGAAGAAYAALPAGSLPDVKFLTGDQVYLDAPFPRYLFNVYAEEDLRAELLATYLASWAQGGDGRGFAELLRSGATYFSSDDHEVWNNAPLPTPVVRATWWPFGDRGAAWSTMATRLYDDFQTTQRMTGLEVGTLSFRVLDTRLARTTNKKQFSRPEDLIALGEWVAGLQGPGVLVVGQPIFGQTSGLKGYLTDFGLPDFDQYAELVRILMSSRHDLLLLTGDVHYGRVASCTLPSGATLTEVIASPFALVDKRVGGTWHAPPLVFPAAPVPGTTQARIRVEGAHDLATNQFATLEFSADGTRVLTTVKAWPIPTPGRAPVSRVVFQRPLS